MAHGPDSLFRRLAACTLAIVCPFVATAPATATAASFAEVIDQVQPKMVKIYGAGGFSGLEAYQSGFLISAEGHVLTVWSYVLDTDFITVHLADGRRLEARLLGADPRLELAVLKVDAAELPHFDLEAVKEADTGDAVLALSNLFNVATGDEGVSAQHGVISVKTRLEARRGAFETPYRGPVYVLDAMTNNPGAAGGALVNRRGELLAMLGKELRNSLNNTWLNYAVPIAEMTKAVADIRAGLQIRPPSFDNANDLNKAEQPLTLSMLGIILVPNVLARTPPFVDEVRADSPAAAAGVKPDDLVLFVNGDRLIQSCNALTDELQYIDRDDSIRVTVIRNQELIDFELKAH